MPRATGALQESRAKRCVSEGSLGGWHAQSKYCLPKTDAGMHEVQTRDLGLRAELRRLLILIDGNTPVSGSPRLCAVRRSIF